MNVSPAALLAMARAMGDLATENVEASWAFRFAVHFFERGDEDRVAGRQGHGVDG